MQDFGSKVHDKMVELLKSNLSLQLQNMHILYHLQDSYEKALGSASDMKPSKSTASSAFVSPLHQDVSSAAAGGRTREPEIDDSREVESVRRDPVQATQGEVER